MKIPGMNDDVGSMDEKIRTADNFYMRTTTHTTTVARLEYSSWWLNSSDMLGNCLNWVILTSSNLSLPVSLKIWPLLNGMKPG
jgi:hypothetical protein